MGEGVLAVTENTFKAEVLDAGLPTLVDFWAEWCGPCRRVGPIIEGLAREYGGKVSFAKCNVDQSPALAEKYAILSIPTVILFHEGQVVDRIVGARGKADYKTWLDSKV